MTETPKPAAARAPMSRSKRTLLIVLGSIVSLVVLVYLAAWLLLPKDFIESQAMKMASKSQGSTIRWKRLTTGLHGLSFGVKIEGMTVRMPAEGQGDPSLDGRIAEVVVRFRLLPLLLRRIEIDAAQVNGAGIAMYERAKPPGQGEKKEERPSFALHIPKLEFARVDLRSRDRYGSGYDVRGLSGHVDIDGTLDAPKEHSEWDKSSGSRRPREPPARGCCAVAAIEPRPGNASDSQTHRAEHHERAGPSGSRLRMARDRGARHHRVLQAPQAATKPSGARPNRSRGLVHHSLLDHKVGGTSGAMEQNGEANLRPLAIEAGPNRFTLDRVQARYETTPDQKFTLDATGAGSGVALAVAAAGSTAPGGGSKGNLHISAPATRLNGLMPNTPVWTMGTLEVGATFALEPPAAPVVRWTITGTDMVTGLQRPAPISSPIDGDQQTPNALRRRRGSVTCPSQAK
jgi:hypothetical protein